jgi:hypothetical protein
MGFVRPAARRYKATLVIAQPQARDRRRALLRAVGSDPG